MQWWDRWRAVFRAGMEEAMRQQTPKLPAPPPQPNPTYQFQDGFTSGDDLILDEVIECILANDNLSGMIGERYVIARYERLRRMSPDQQLKEILKTNMMKEADAVIAPILDQENRTRS